jgi:GNAT superfamily N-acetyltransferase
MVSEWSRDDYRVTTDISTFDFDVVHRYLSEDAYWSPGISREKVERAAAHSLAFGLFHRDAQIGYARAITDTVSFAYLADVFVLPGRQRDGLGTWLVECLMAHPDLQGLRKMMLTTTSAHTLYARFGFAVPAQPENLMEKRAPE